jgi:hypothetical protein
VKRSTLVTVAVLSIAALGAYLAFDPAPTGATPRRIRELGPWLQQHPADWIATSIVVDKTLDSTLPQRDPLWRAAYAHSQLLAPYRDAPHLAFLRSGLSHWYELGEADRRLVRENAAPLLTNLQQFRDLHRAIWEVTGDFALLRRWNPGTAEAFSTLADLAVRNGLFAEYRDCREQYLRLRFEEFSAARAMMPPPEIAFVLPDEVMRDDQPLLQAALDEWHRRPLDSNPVRSVNGAIQYALRHAMQPLDGLDYLVTHPYETDPLRARLAVRDGRFDRATDLEISSSEVAPAAWRQYHVDRAYAAANEKDPTAVRIELFKAAQGGLDAEVLAAAVALQQSTEAHAELLRKFSVPAEWQGLCEADVCRAAASQWYTEGAAQHIVVLSAVQTDEAAPYAELYVDELRVAEGPVGEATAFTIGAPAAGVHRVRVRLANPLTRNLLQRRVRIGP